MSALLREVLLTAASAIVAYAVFWVLALFLKAESATWPKPEDRPS